ncbi:MAG: 4Fe-4S binding protein [Geoalkalibacter sp.]|uniref:4Fe-4S binding protein n=1 Tax=Geoalkalibacter sp. TaxID=3041440 RepID=UPI003D148F74
MLPRYLVQAGFLGFYGWLIVKFARWVASLQSETLPAFPRPVAIDGFLPLNGLAGLRYWLSSGEWYPAHAAAAFIVLAALLSALLLKRGFCSWICPVFPLSEGLWRLGEKLMGRSPECFACYRCVHNCPAPGAVTLRVAGKLGIPSLLFGIMLLGLFAAMDLYGRVEGRWHDERAPQAIHRQLLELKQE